MFSLLCLLALHNSASSAQNYSGPLCAGLESSLDLIPWEAEDVVPKSPPSESIISPARLPAELVIWLIHRYQSGIATRSIQRCPFSLSCSHFAIEAIRRHGAFVGLCLFIDRNLYRENPQIFYLYDLVETRDGALKLDDRYYLGEAR